MLSFCAINERGNIVSLCNTKERRYKVVCVFRLRDILPVQF